MTNFKIKLSLNQALKDFIKTVSSFFYFFEIITFFYINSIFEYT